MSGHAPSPEQERRAVGLWLVIKPSSGSDLSPHIVETDAEITIAWLNEPPTPRHAVPQTGHFTSRIDRPGAVAAPRRISGRLPGAYRRASRLSAPDAQRDPRKWRPSVG